MKAFNKLKIILLPLSKLYEGASLLHRKLHHSGLLSYSKFDIPIINIGNLAFGGTGKSPHVLWMHDFLENKQISTAIVSRGYNRKTKGLIWVHPNATAEDVGDEPLLFKRKLPDTPIVISKKRSLAVEAILNERKDIDVILLDDALQHWAIESSINVLLTTFEAPFFEANAAPMGYLREAKSGYKRADIIIVTKCPSAISLENKKSFIQKIKPLPNQKVFFSYYNYLDCYALFNPKEKLLLASLKNKDLLIVTGIANTSYLEKFVQTNSNTATYLRFPDHHYFSTNDLDKIALAAQGKVIITTEKDTTRLLVHQDYILQNNLAFYCLPIGVQIAFGEENLLKEQLLLLLKK